MESNSLARRRIETASGVWTFAEVGSGPSLVCLPGEIPGATAAADYVANVEALSRQFRLVLLDALPESAVLEPRADDEAPALVEFLDAAGIDHAAFMGNGRGASVAVRLALV